MIIESFLPDLRVGGRVLLKEKSFCIIAVFVLAIGISAVTTMFSVVNGVMLRGFSFPTRRATRVDPIEALRAEQVTSRNFIPAGTTVLS